MSSGEFAIIGTGEVPCGNYPERSEFEIAYTVARDAIRDAGIDVNEIGAVLCAQHIMSNPDNDYNTEMVFGRLPEAIGAKGCKITCMTSSGGASSSLSARRRRASCTPGRRIPCWWCTPSASPSSPPTSRPATSPSPARTWSGRCPYGMTYNSLAAMITQAYMSITGTTIEQVAAVCVANRRWAMLQPNAMFNNKEITVEKVVTPAWSPTRSPR